MWKKKRLFFSVTVTVFALLTCNSCISPETKKIKEVEKAIVEIIDSTLLENKNLDALSIGIFSPNRNIEIHRGKLLNGKSPSNQSLYEIASISKSFVGYLIVNAIVEGKLKLTEDIREYLTSNFPNLEYNNHPISVKHLVTHRSGLPLFFPYQEDLYENELNWDSIPFAWNKVQDGFSKKQFFEELNKFSLNRKPGSRPEYSNTGTNLCAYLLEEIYEKKFSALLHSEIFSKSGMQNSYASLDHVKKENELFVVKGKNENNLLMPLRATKEMNAEGGIITTVSDMIKFMKFNLELSEPYTELLQNKIISDSINDFHLGFFWQFEFENANPIEIFQVGGSYGTTSRLSLFLPSKTGIFLVTNSAGDSVHKELEYLKNRVLRILNN